MFCSVVLCSCQTQGSVGSQPGESGKLLLALLSPECVAKFQKVYYIQQARQREKQSRGTCNAAIASCKIGCNLKLLLKLYVQRLLRWNLENIFTLTHVLCAWQCHLLVTHLSSVVSDKLIFFMAMFLCFNSERAESTGATGDRLKEGSAINQSLSTLGNCIKGTLTLFLSNSWIVHQVK